MFVFIAEFKVLGVCGGIGGVGVAIILFVFESNSSERIIGNFVIVGSVLLLVSLLMVLQVNKVLDQYNANKAGISRTGSKRVIMGTHAVHVTIVGSNSPGVGGSQQNSHMDDISYSSHEQTSSNNNSSNTGRSSTNATTSSLRVNNIYSNKKGVKQRRLKMRLLLADEEGFELFAQHLVTEMSIEVHRFQFFFLFHKSYLCLLNLLFFVMTVSMHAAKRVFFCCLSFVCITFFWIYIAFVVYFGI